MSSESTEYVISTKYVLDERLATASLGKIATEAERAGKHVEGLDHAFHAVAGAVGAHWLFHEGVKSFVTFNSELEQMKISMSAIIEMNLGGTFKHAQAQSEELFKEFQNFSKKTPVTTKEVMEFGTGVSAAVFGAGGAMKDFIKITEQGVIASKVFGANAQYAALEIQELLMGNVNKRMRFAMQLLHAAGVSEASFKAMSASQRMSTVEKVLDSDAMKQAADAFSNSFEGVTSTLKDNIEIALGKIGLPLFKAITAEVQRWNDWIDKNPGKIEEFAKTFANALVTGFNAVKAAATFVIDHKEAFMALAAVWAGGKVVGGLSNLGLTGGKYARMFSGAMGGFALGTLGSQTGDGFHAEWTDRLGQAASAAAGALGTLPGPIGWVAKGFLALKGASDLLAEAMNESIEQHHQQIIQSRFGQYDLERLQEFSKHYGQVAGGEYLSRLAADGQWLGPGGKMDDQMRRQAFHMLMNAKDAGALENVGGGIVLDSGKLRGALANSPISDSDKAVFIGMAKIAHDLMQADGELRAMVKDSMAPLKGFFETVADEAKEKGERPHLGAGDTNIVIQHMEVASDDPDMFVQTFEDIGRTARKNPAQARQQLRGFGG